MLSRSRVSNKKPPAGVHVSGTIRGEEMALKEHEAGRNPGRKNYRSARDSTGVNPSERDPIDPRMPNIPPQ